VVSLADKDSAVLAAAMVLGSRVLVPPTNVKSQYLIIESGLARTRGALLEHEVRSRRFAYTSILVAKTILCILVMMRKAFAMVGGPQRILPVCLPAGRGTTTLSATTRRRTSFWCTAASPRFRRRSITGRGASRKPQIATSRRRRCRRVEVASMVPSGATTRCRTGWRISNGEWRRSAKPGCPRSRGERG